MKNLFVSIVVMISSMVSISFADSVKLDTDRLNKCGGIVELRESDDGLALKFDGQIKNWCSKVVFYDYSTKKVIKSYDVKGNLSGKTYNFSKEQVQHLNGDCKLGWSIIDDRGDYAENFKTTIHTGKCAPKKTAKVNTIRWMAENGYYCEESQKHNLKVMRNGEFQQQYRFLTPSECNTLNSLRSNPNPFFDLIDILINN